MLLKLVESIYGVFCIGMGTLLCVLFARLTQDHPEVWLLPFVGLSLWFLSGVWHVN